MILEEVATERARAGRARAAFVAIFVTVCAFHFWFDGGLAFAEPGGGSQSGSKVVPPPCCHSGSQEGRRATEAIGEGFLASPCIPCPGSSSSAGSSMAAAW